MKKPAWGLVRHIFLRQGAHSGDVLVCLVCTVPQLSQQELLAAELIEAFPTVRTVLLNVNSDKTNVILGSRNVILAGSGWIEDTMCDVPIRLGPLSFYQVNTPAAENLYRIAAEKAALRSTDRLLDLYCGMGTIGLSMIGRCAELIGVEVIPEAIEAAKRSAAAMGGDVAQRCRFLCADAADAAQQLADDGVKPDVVVLDPPRKGCDQQTLDAVIRMAPRTICNGKL
jgi:23S rRNA (uracil1939-C5)-methyltransferase